MLEFEKKLREEALLRNLSDVTFKTYFYRLRRFYNYFQKPLSEISLSEIREYFLYLLDVKNSGKEAIRNTRYAIQFYYIHCLKYTDQNYKLNFVKVKYKKKIPVILTRSEVRKLFKNVKISDYQCCLMLMYSCGLRIGEAVKLRIADIDGERRIITIRNGKGDKDRSVPVPENVLAKLRSYWKTHENREILFPKRSILKTFDRSKTKDSVSKRTLQSAMKLALSESGINKNVTTHTLRHSFATHLLEAGANIKAISNYLGHKTLEPTMIYLHLTNNSEIHSYNILNSIMSDL